MLKPTYFDGAQTELIESYYEKLENWLMNDIAQRLLKAGEMSGTADRNIWLLQQLGLQKAEINKKLIDITGLSNKELKSLLEDAVLTSWENDAATMAKLGKTISSPLENERYMQVINAEFQKCKNDLNNLTNTTMDTAQSDLIKMLNEAEMRVASGSQSYTGAVCELMDNYAKKGMQVGYPTVTYHNDAGNPMKVTSTRSLESAIQTALRTSMNQTAAQVTNQYINDNGIEYVLVSAHLGARHSKKYPEGVQSHDWWQGKAYKIRGSEDGYPNLLESTGYDIDPITGEGMVVNPLGLHGYNCRHSHQPWDKNLKNPWIDENGNAIISQEESEKQYAINQQQRGMERAIRSTKRQLMMKKTEINGVAETDVKSSLQPQYDQLADKLKKQNQVYDQFCKDNNLNKQADRLKVIGYKRTKMDKIVTPENKEGNMNRREFVPILQFKKTAAQMNELLDDYTMKASKWNGKVHIDPTLSHNTGKINEDFSFSLSNKASKGSFIHELLHQRSWVYNEELYIYHRNIEEASVQLLTEEICKDKGYAFAYTYEEQVDALRKIRKIFNEYPTDLDFAKSLFEIPMEKRYGWLYTEARKRNVLTDEIELMFSKISGGDLGYIGKGEFGL